jgi:hypothetical protein
MATKSQYAYWLVRCIEGDDDLEEIYKALYEDNFVDESGFWVYPENEE